MNETTEMWREVRRDKQERHLRNHAANLALLQASGLAYTLKNDREVALFREPGKPKVDFYPSSGRWRYNNRTYDGGAKAFLVWYAKRAA